MKQILFFSIICLVVLSACKKEDAISAFCVGDSTMSNKSPEAYPEHGWCMVLNDYFKESLVVRNHAKNGRSSKSFIDEGRWQVVLDSLKAGDYVFIQFGHNDQKDYDSTRYTIPFESYSDNLRKFVVESREKGAIPILFTSIVRRKFGEDGRLVDTHGDYPVATRKVASELDVPLIDLQKLTEKWVNTLGDEPSKKMYLWTEITTDRYKEPRKDDTHLSLDGANNVAQIALKELETIAPELRNHMK